MDLQIKKLVNIAQLFGLLSWYQVLCALPECPAAVITKVSQCHQYCYESNPQMQGWFAFTRSGTCTGIAKMPAAFVKMRNLPLPAFPTRETGISTKQNSFAIQRQTWQNQAGNNESSV